jgi:hypothetical protein
MYACFEMLNVNADAHATHDEYPVCLVVAADMFAVTVVIQLHLCTS